MATCDDAADAAAVAAVAAVNAAAESRPSRAPLHLVDALALVGDAFGCASDIEAAVAASAFETHDARGETRGPAGAADDGRVKNKNTAVRGAPGEGRRGAFGGQLGAGSGRVSDADDSDAPSTARGYDSSDAEMADSETSDAGSDGAADAAEDHALDSDQLTRLYVSKRKCHEREALRVEALRASAADRAGDDNKGAEPASRELGGDGGKKKARRVDPSGASGASGALGASSPSARGRVTLSSAPRSPQGGRPPVPGPAAAGAMTAEMHGAAREQIFSPEGAFARLCSELFAFGERGDEPRHRGVVAEPVEHSVYDWDVKITREAFDPSSGLYSDLDILESINGYSHVRLRLSFAPDLYPFYPPVVSVTRPRFVGDAIPGACAAHPMLHLRNWRPLTPVASVVGKLRRFLQRHARVDLASERNDPEAFPRGAYSDEVSELENALARLAARGTSRGPAITPRHFRDLYDAMTPESDEDDVEDEDNNAARYVDPDRGPEGSEGVAANGDEGKDAGKRRKGKGAAEMASGTKKKRGNASASAEGSDAKEGDRTVLPWAKGTGYGYDAGESNTGGGDGAKDDGKGGGGGGEGGGGGGASGREFKWDAAAARVAQTAEDAAVRSLVEKATRFAKALTLAGGDSRAAAGPAGAASSAEAGRKRLLANPPGGGKRRAEGEPSTNPSRGKKPPAPAAGAPPPAPKRTHPPRPPPITLAPGSVARVGEALKRSCLGAFLARELRGCAFMDMVQRDAYYACLAEATLALAESPVGAECLRGAGEDVGAVVGEAARQAKVYLASVGDAAEGGGGTDDDDDDDDNDALFAADDEEDGVADAAAAAAEDASASSPAASSPAASSEKRSVRRAQQRLSLRDEWKRDARRHAALARRIVRTGEAVLAAFANADEDAAEKASSRGKTTASEKTSRGKPTRGKGKGKGKGTTRDDAGGAGPTTNDETSGAAFVSVGGSEEDASDESQYCAALRGLAFDQASLGASHAFHGESVRDVAAGPHLTRVAREVAGLGSTLPLSPSSSAFVRVDERSAVLWSVVITGPEDTPYDGGVFAFDFFFPSQYPHAPPKVQFRTTGGGRARFNPNLYKDGKVCLSLLGTWSGAKGETWDPAVSTTLQVIVSVQSLILCPRPYFNEPGFEKSAGTKEGERRSAEYDDVITEHTLRYAMLEMVKKPPEGFEEVVREHFRRRRGRILGPVKDAWLKAKTSAESRKRAEGLFAELEKELNAL